MRHRCCCNSCQPDFSSIKICPSDATLNQNSVTTCYYNYPIKHSCIIQSSTIKTPLWHFHSMAVTLDNTVSMPETHRYLWNIGDWFHLVGTVDGHLWNPQGTADVSPFSPTSTQQYHINTSPTCILIQIRSTFFYWKAANTTKTTASFPLISKSITGTIQCYKTTGRKTSIKRVPS